MVVPGDARLLLTVQGPRLLLYCDSSVLGIYFF